MTSNRSWNYNIDLARTYILKAVGNLQGAEHELAEIGMVGYTETIQRRAQGLRNLHADLGTILRQGEESLD